jgi:predicted dehydrogenase
MKIAIIGIGKMGLNHAKTIEKHSECELVGFLDLSQKAIDNALSIYPDKIQFKSVHQISTMCDAVIIAVPTSIHYEYLTQCSRVNINVLCEKASVSSLDDYHYVNSFLGDFNKIINIGHVERFNPCVKTFKNLNVDNSKKVYAKFYRHSNTTRNEDVSCVFDTMIHDIDLALYMFNLGEFRRVYIKKIKESEGYIYSVNCICIFDNGTISFSADKRGKFPKREFFYTNGLNDYRFFLSELNYTHNNEFNTCEPSEKDQLTQQLDAFIDACNSKENRGVTLEQNKKAIDIANEIELEIENYLSLIESENYI